MPNHTIKQGECLATIAHRNGIADPKVIWDLPQNAELKAKRKDPNVLFPGDVIFIPDKQDKSASKPTGRTHEFQAKQPPKRLHLILQDAKNQPLASKPYKLAIEGGDTLTGTTDGAGVIDKPIPVTAQHATLEVEKHRWELDIGHLNPVLHTPDEGFSGIVARLRNLGYYRDQAVAKVQELYRAAVKSFQEDFGLPATGTPDEATKKKIEEAHRGEAKPAPKQDAPKKQDAPAAAAPKQEAPKQEAPKPQAAAKPKPKGGGAAASPPSVKVVEKLPDTPALCATLAKQKKKQPSNAVAPTTPNVLKPARKGTCDLCKNHDDCLDNDYDFLVAVAGMAERLDGEATGFMGIMHFETGHRYSPSIKNPGSGAVGLIQFMPSTAKGMGTTTETLGAMCRIEQLGYVEKYFQSQQKAYPHADYTTVRDVVLAVFEPVGLRPDHDILGVRADICKGPYFDAPTGRTDVTDAMTAYYKAHKKEAKGAPAIYDAKGNLIGVNSSKVYWTATKDGKEVTVTSHQRAVYAGNGGLDKDKDGFLMRDDYPGIVDGLIKGCAKEACEKASALQKELPKDYEIIKPGTEQAPAANNAPAAKAAGAK